MKDDRKADCILSNNSYMEYSKKLIEKLTTQIVPEKILDDSPLGFFYEANGKSIASYIGHTVPKNYLAADYVVTEAVTEHKNQIPLYPEFFGLCHNEFVYDKDKLPKKKFNCFISRSCPFRQGWMYQFVRNNLLDNAHITFWSENWQYSQFSPVELFDYYFQFNEIFADEHRQLRNQIPFKNFNMSLEDAIIDSEKSLILETFFEDTDQILFTEKTMRALQLPRPWYLMGHPGAVGKLREWGFDVFDDWIDHSYDHELIPHKRQRLILEQIDSKIPYTASLCKEFDTRAKNNSNLLKKLRYQYLNHIEKAILEKLKNELR